MYQEAMDYYKGVDLCRIGELYTTGEHCCKYIDVEKEDLWDQVEYVAFDSEARICALEKLIKPAPHYLVMAHNVRWTGASGYKITERIGETINRGYEASIYPVAVSKGGKCLICRESSHDNPMGAQTSIIALTEREYERLKNADWEKAAAFEEKITGGLA